ncbi:acireductone synthase [Streptomyces sp. WMMB 322]|uniref:acireductone synthase n=1 Tax=Streptomyces sp. WMMB 322 TaxID=1286821 RepID=UPI0006E277E8|nr:acireductone synthase [Streptomyces sp. WMMB 322]SCK30143.1 acireductone synthase [Streptomyces sp. WMMB 322]
MTAETTPVRAVVLDIEGTTGSASHVHDVLFPYARKRFADWLAAHRGERAHAELLREIRDFTGDAALGEEEAVTALERWSDQDLKAPPLKRAQGLIWADGYARGELAGHVYDDVPSALALWRHAGIDCFIYSSGSRAAQRDWFAHSNHGDLSGLVCDHFDLLDAGNKHNAESYRNIAEAVRTPPGEILFLSDECRELDAAATAGWQTVAVRRPGDPRGAQVDGHRVVVSSLDELRLLSGSRTTETVRRTADVPNSPAERPR